MAEAGSLDVPTTRETSHGDQHRSVLDDPRCDPQRYRVRPGGGRGGGVLGPLQRANPRRLPSRPAHLLPVGRRRRARVSSGRRGRTSSCTAELEQRGLAPATIDRRLSHGVRLLPVRAHRRPHHLQPRPVRPPPDRAPDRGPRPRPRRARPVPVHRRAHRPAITPPSPCCWA